MADIKITDLATGTAVVAGDWFLYVDVSDTTMAATGTDKKLSPAVLTAGLSPFVASGTGHAPGIVPDPGAVAGTTKFLREDATWQVPAGGGGGTPGGATGTVQYNNAGAFGGFVVAGDGTLNTGTGALTVTKTGGVTFAPSATIDTTNAANIASGILVPARLPVFIASGGTHAIGAVPDPGASAGTTRYLREDATWFVPPGGGSGTPGGSAGQVQWNSAGAFGGFTVGGDATLNTGTGALTIASGAITYPKMQNVAASSLIGNPTGSAAAHSEIGLGPTLAFSGSILRGNCPAYMGRSGAVLTNSSTLTSLLAAITTDLGSLTIPAGALNALGRVLRFQAYGTYGCTATATLTVTLTLGGLTIATNTTATLAAVTGKLWMIDIGIFTTRVTGTSGIISGYTHFYGVSSVGLGGNAVIFMTSGGAGAAPGNVTIDLTGTLAVDLKAQWNEVSATDTIGVQTFAFWIDG